MARLIIDFAVHYLGFVVRSLNKRFQSRSLLPLCLSLTHSDFQYSPLAPPPPPPETADMGVYGGMAGNGTWEEEEERQTID